MKNKLILPSIGALAGLTYAFMTKRSFWGYVGFFALGSIGGTLANNVLRSNNGNETSASQPLTKPSVERPTV
jgi:hypothetical protein